MIVGQRRQAFTLLEVMLVMAILIIIMAALYPSLEGMYGDTRVRGAADDVRGAWAEARVRSIDSGISYRFAMIPGTGKFCVSPDSAEYSDGSKTIASDHEMDDGTVLVGVLPKGITFDLDLQPGQNVPEEAGGWRTLVSFLPNGTCRDDASIKLKGPGSPPLLVSVRGLTGIVTVKTLKQEEGR